MSAAPAPAMPVLPADVAPYKRTATFDEATLPAGLRQRHTTREGTWAKIHVLSGSITYELMGPEAAAFTLTPDAPGIAPPTLPHRLVVSGPVALYVEFHALPRPSSA